MAEIRGAKLVFGGRKSSFEKNAKYKKLLGNFLFVVNWVVQRVVRLGESESEVGFN